MICKLIKILYLFFLGIKNKTKIKSINASIYAKYGKGVLIDRNTIVSDDVIIGDYSYINKNSSIENCEIGKYCSISSGVYICPFEHPLNHITTHPVGYIDVEKKRDKVIIGNDVLISLNVVVLSGVHISDGAVVGAGAVVTKDVAPYEIVGGVPAKHISFRTTENNIKLLEQMSWWDMDDITINEKKGWLSSNINDVGKSE